LEVREELGAVVRTEARTARHGNHREVGPQEPVWAEVPADVLRRTRGGPRDACIPRSVAMRGAALRTRAPDRRRKRHRLLDVAGEQRAGEPAPARRSRSSTPSWRVLQVVRAATPGAGELINASRSALPPRPPAAQGTAAARQPRSGQAPVPYARPRPDGRLRSAPFRDRGGTPISAATRRGSDPKSARRRAPRSRATAAPPAPR
jgi:hypothetical protein